MTFVRLLLYWLGGGTPTPSPMTFPFTADFATRTTPFVADVPFARSFTAEF